MATREQVELVWEHLQMAHPAAFFKTLSEGNAGISAVLRILYESPNDMTAGNISEFMHVSTARVAVLLKKLETQGLIVKDCDVNDARITIVRLSETGRQKVEQMREEVCAELGAVIDKVGMERMMEFIAISDEIKSAIKVPDFQF